MTLKLQIVSDLHLDFLPDLSGLLDLIKPSAPYLAVLGDTCEIEHRYYLQFLELIAPHWKRIIIINGNHEFYGNLTQTKSDLEELQRDMVSKYDNIVILENDHIDIDGVRIVGTTLWSHIPKQAEESVTNNINDYFRIATSQLKPMTVKEVNEWHDLACTYLETILDETTGPVIVLTHHAPYRQGTSHPMFEMANANLTNHSYSTNLERLFKDRENVLVWAFGHTHWCCDFKHGGTRVCSNPRGYRQCENYNPEFTIEV